jgi:hypothetical protein
LTDKAGWGTSGLTTLADGIEVFTKRLPLTDVEVAHPRSTKNRFRLPPCYSYGVGSAGMGAWRELAVHERVRGLEQFPELLDWRVQARDAGDRPLPMSLDDYVAYWNGNERIGEYMRARATATNELCLALRPSGEMGFQWLLAHQHDAERFLAEALEAVAVLRGIDVVHFDAHLANVVVSDRARLTDFGLSMAHDFELSAAERRFVERHRHYDVGTVFGSLGQMLLGAVGSMQPKAFDRAVDERAVPYAPELWAIYERCRQPIRYMLEHFDRMMRPSKRSRYDDAVLVELLKSSGIALG